MTTTVTTNVTREEMDEQRSLAGAGIANGSRWAGLSYEEGVEAALAWVVGDSTTAPMEDEDEGEDA